MVMNVHAPRPACYLEAAEPEARDHAFRDQARWCYMRVEEARRLTPGCMGCRRFKEQVAPEIPAGGAI